MLDLPRPDETLSLIKSRRTLKPVDMDPEQSIPRALLDKLLEAANWAPNHGKTEPWRFHVFQGEARQQLCDNLPALYDEITPADEVRPEKRAKLEKLPLLAPVILAVVRAAPSNPKIPQIEETAAVACAVQNLCLLAAANGVGSFWSSPPLVYTPQMTAFLGQDDDSQCLGLLYLGYPLEGKTAVASGSRRPVDEKVTWVS